VSNKDEGKGSDNFPLAQFIEE